MMNLSTVRAVPRAVLARAGWRGLTGGLAEKGPLAEDTSKEDRPLLPCTTAFELMHEVRVFPLPLFPSEAGPNICLASFELTGSRDRALARTGHTRCRLQHDTRICDLLRGRKAFNQSSVE